MNYSKMLKEEGNHKEFTYRGVDGLILRVDPMWRGHLCGYAKLGKEVAEGDPELTIDVHGGITFTGRIAGEDGWVGFDCAHTGDMLPSWEKETRDLFSEYGYTYKDMDYVENEIKRMIDQVLDVV